MTVRPFPDISAAAWTVLLRGPEAGPITRDLAAGIVGPDLAAGAVAELDAKHLIDEQGLSPLARTLRRWHQKREGGGHRARLGQAAFHPASAASRPASRVPAKAT